jgi:hypothetical protein
MTHEQFLPIPVTQVVVETPAVLQPAEVLPQQQTSPEQVRAVDGVFSESSEGEKVLGLVGLWTGAMLLKDLAAEHFHLPAEEEEEPGALPKPEGDEPVP